MSDGALGQSDWWRDKVWELQHKQALAEARIEALQNTDGLHREELQDLRREMAAIRAEMGQGFKDLNTKFDLYIGALREDIASMKAVPAQDRGGFRIPSARVIFFGLIAIAAIAFAAFGMGAATNTANLARGAMGLITN